MLTLIRKIFCVILSVGIILSSAGFTILNHFCKLEQSNYVSVEEFFKSKCNHFENHKSCCELSHQSCCFPKESTGDTYSYKSFDNCCTDQKYFSKIEVATNEKNLKKFTDVYKVTIKVDYVKNLIKDNLNQKYEQFKINVINPVQRLIRLIHIISNFVSSEKSEALL